MGTGKLADGRIFKSCRQLLTVELAHVVLAEGVLLHVYSAVRDPNTDMVEH